ncbi:hyalin-like [Amphiura filiformis]|uniref:hyalin-like n=1 Tax=Amphiura filiformis TaxID=82378 RepID=UPI003B216403
MGLRTITFTLLCVSVTIFKALATCNFESSLCGYTQTTDDVFDWTRNSGGTPSSSTGPSSDHTTGSGYYIYTETSSPRVAGDTARLISPSIPGNAGGPRCRINFWYHMYGTGMGTLRVYARTVVGGDSSLWSRSGNQGNQWYSASLSYAPQTEFQVVFVGYRGSDYKGDIALDDIVISDCADVTPPQITIGCPSNIDATMELGMTGKAVTWTEPSATDSSGTPVKMTSHQPGANFPVGLTDVRYTFTDAYNNVASCNFIVNIETVDTLPPDIAGCPNDFIATFELGTTGTMLNWTEPTATDHSGTPQRSRSHVPGSEFLTGLTTVNYNFTDTANNTAFCIFSVTVEIVDSVPPQVSQCPNDTDSFVGRHISWVEPTTSDLSNNVTCTRSLAPGTYIITTTPVVYTFTDSSGNVAYCNFTINIIQDNTPPTILDCVPDIHASAEVGKMLPSIYWSKPTAIDDSGRVMLTDFTHVPGQHFPIGSTMVS